MKENEIYKAVALSGVIFSPTVFLWSRGDLLVNLSWYLVGVLSVYLYILLTYRIVSFVLLKKGSPALLVGVAALKMPLLLFLLYFFSRYDRYSTLVFLSGFTVFIPATLWISVKHRL